MHVEDEGTYIRLSYYRRYEISLFCPNDIYYCVEQSYLM